MDGDVLPFIEGFYAQLKRDEVIVADCGHPDAEQKLVVPLRGPVIINGKHVELVILCVDCTEKLTGVRAGRPARAPQKESV